VHPPSSQVKRKVHLLKSTRCRHEARPKSGRVWRARKTTFNAPQPCALASHFGTSTPFTMSFSRPKSSPNRAATMMNN